ncbi:MAG: type I DNA topoisomerase [Tissierellia bacterium]|nr:type I DNA topoisomerase [Tissierellia bacterium]
MAKNLVIVESPTKARTISKMLGRNYKVKASFGHLRDLPKSRMGVDIENDFTPEYIKVRGRAKTINELKKDVKNAQKVFLATDPDREGEAISWHLNYLMGLDENSKNRIEFHEITKNQVLKALKNPRKIDMNLVDAQQARRVVDRIVGYEISPILWKRIKSGLSAGRVQSVALKLICDRQKEIDRFKPEEYWTIDAFHKKSTIKFVSSLQSDENSKKIKIENEKSAKSIIEKIDKENFIVNDIKKIKKKRNPQKPYTTSTLQQDASNKLGFSTKTTMMIAQQLFEGINIGQEGSVGLITYMRTDATRLSSEIINEAIKYIKENYGEEYATKGNSYDKKSKNAQDAHEAIRPTAIYRSPYEIKDYLSDLQFKLYNLIWIRTVQSQMKAYEYLSTQISLINNGYIFKANGNQTVFDGYTKISQYRKKEQLLPDLKKDDKLKAYKIEKTQHFTKPPAKYTEASLVKALEENGIGRPSTYSSTINSILSRNYVEILDRQLSPTELGFTVNDFLEENFADIINVDFTASMESRLDDIAENQVKWKEVVSSFYKEFKKDINKAKKDSTDYKVKTELLDEKCPKCGHNLAIKHGRNGKFVGCSNFPNCDFTKSIVKKVGVKCPKCGHDLIEKVTKHGKRFYGCENYPKCDYAVWDKPVGKKCPKCNHPLLHKKTRKVDMIYCDNCGYVESEKK